jgi:hypothetical protein
MLLSLCILDVHSQEVEDGDVVPLARVHRESNLSQAGDSLSEDMMPVKDVAMEEGMMQIEDTVQVSDDDTIVAHITLTTDSLMQLVGSKPKGRFVPDPKKALWLSIVFPGGGQIYNRKYWKLPLVYGGFLGCVYAMTWNNTMYRDYSQAYIDIMDSDENTKSYENFIPAHYDVKANEDRLKELFRRKKNYYRRYRDLSMFCMIGVYALSIIDAYVDAELSSFDISRDLTLRVHPTVINEKHSALRAQGINPQSYGLQCSLVF